MKIKIFTAALFSVCLPFYAYATGDTKQSSVELPKVIANAPDSKNIKVLKKVDNVALGLDAYVISTGAGINSVVYSDKKGDYAFIGILLGPEGENVTQNLISANQPAVDTKALYSDLQSIPYIEEGKGANPVYVFYDPNCGYCKQLYTDTRDMVKNNQIRIRWVLVGILGNDSIEKAMGIMSSPSPAQAFADYMTTGISEKKKMAAQNQTVMNNLAKTMQMMVTYQIMGTPALVYKSGQDIKVVRGIPGKKELNALADTLALAKAK